VTAAAPGWVRVAAAGLLLLFGLSLLFWDTARGMVSIWATRDTYMHGFIILPISLWLVWQKRAYLRPVSPAPIPAILVLLPFALLLWALARLTGVLVVEQTAFVATLVLSFAALLGWQVSKFLAFPLLFLFLAVPMGEDLIPPMMEFTATFTVEALKLTGIPVYREGLFFSLPSGNWSVVEACSGVRYIIASATLGVMYAYISYHTLWKRLLFIAFSIIVPIFANGIRAYMIVMIGHLSDMKYATGVDHLLYGWIFFGVVMFLLFWIGSIWQETEDPSDTTLKPEGLITGFNVRLGVIVILSLGLAAISIALTRQAESIEVETAGELSPPAEIGEWRLSEDRPAWSVAHLPSEHVIEASYVRGGETVNLFVVVFPQQSQGREAINAGNRIAEGLVRSVKLKRRKVALGDSEVAVNRQRALIGNAVGQREQLVWQWYRVAGLNLTNRYLGKGWEALARIYPGRADGAWVAVSTPVDVLNTAEAEARLHAFTESGLAPVASEIDRLLGN
jgi:exosortase A